MRRPTRVLWLAVMLTTMLATRAALARYGLTGGFNLFHAAALVSLATLLAATFCAWRARATHNRGMQIAHGIFMSWTYFGLVMAFVAEMVTRKLPHWLHGEGGWTRFAVFLILLMLLAGIATQGLIRRRILRARPHQGAPIAPK